MREFFQKDLFFKFAQDDLGLGVFSGIASAFGPPADRHGDIIDAGAFAQSLAEHRANGTLPSLLWQHQPDEPIGAWVSLLETERGLEGVGRLALETQRGREAHSLMKMNAIGLSIGFGVADGGAYEKDGVTHFQKIDLIEVSAVSIPANSRARITEVKAALFRSPREFEAVVRDALGLSAREAKRLASGGYRGLARDEQADDNAELAAIAAKLQKITAALIGR